MKSSPGKLAALFLILAGMYFPALAQDKAAELEKHPAVQVVRLYLKAMMAQDWKASAELVDPQSMNVLRDDYLNRAKKTATLEEERELLKQFNQKSLEDIGKIPGKEFYVTYHAIMKDRYSVPPEVMEKVRSSFVMTVVSVGEEGDSLAHVLVRTKHSNDKAMIDNIELISLTKIDGKWLVALNAQSPKITPIKEGQPTSVPPVTNPETPQNPAGEKKADPVKKPEPPKKTTPPKKPAK